MHIQWSNLHTYTKSNEDIDAPWLMALESFGDATYLKIEGDGAWVAHESVLPKCGPNGLAGIKMPDDTLIVTASRFGSLIGKLGGSSASHKVPDTPAESLAVSEPFAIGAFCILKIPDNMPGPLFLGFNAVSQTIHIETLTVKIYGSRPTV